MIQANAHRLSRNMDRMNKGYALNAWEGDQA